MNDEDLINEVFREVTGCTSATAISWTNVGKPVCLKIMQKARADQDKKIIALLESERERISKPNNSVSQALCFYILELEARIKALAQGDKKG